jgi:hypothetical protein
MAKVFISYRRKDSQMAAGRLAHSLRAHFGASQVFRDKESIQPGADWVSAIGREISSGGVMLALIGCEWSEARDDAGARRLDDPDDPNRQELVSALAAGATVIPVLVEGAKMPERETLPEDLRKLARRNALKLRDDEWDNDIRKMISAMAACGVVADAPQGSDQKAEERTADEVSSAIRPALAHSPLSTAAARQSTGNAANKKAALAGLAAVVVFAGWGAMQSVQRSHDKAAMPAEIAAAVSSSTAADGSAYGAAPAAAPSLSVSKFATSPASNVAATPAIGNAANNASNIESEEIKMQIKKLGQMQRAQSKLLDSMDQEAKNAIRHIKGG